VVQTKIRRVSAGRYRRRRIMPPKKRQYDEVPEWIHELRESDPYLWEVVVEAWEARHAGVTRGALKHAKEHPACAAAWESADVTMEAVRDGRVTGANAYKKAAVAVRKFTVAAECAHPTASRYSRKRHPAD
jgi:hypothetical protein